MSTLGIIIYLAEVSQHAAIFFCLLSLALMTGSAVCALVFLIDDEKIPSWMRKAALAGLALGIISVLLPSSDTIYMIAAAEYGQEAIASEFGQEVIKEAKDALIRTLRDAGGSAQ